MDFLVEVVAFSDWTPHSYFKNIEEALDQADMVHGRVVCPELADQLKGTFMLMSAEEMKVAQPGDHPHGLIDTGDNWFRIWNDDAGVWYFILGYGGDDDEV